MRNTIQAFLGFLLTFLVFGNLSAAGNTSPSGVLTGVSGTVQVNGKAAKNAAKVNEGQKVRTGTASKTTLRLFDGSQIALSSNSELQVNKIQKSSAADKVLKFKLLVGKLVATVKKLNSSRSSFEVESGGVVCGVRGTQYILQYDPVTGKVNVKVLDGSVWVSADGKTYTFGPGQGGTFTHGHKDGEPEDAGSNFNPFYGFSGNPGDDFNNSLTDLAGGLDGITDQTRSDSRADAGNLGVILNLAFPEYAP